jgi:hypothetical protein
LAFWETSIGRGPFDPKLKQPGPWKNSYFQGPKSDFCTAAARGLSMAGQPAQPQRCRIKASQKYLKYYWL